MSRPDGLYRSRRGGKLLVIHGHAKHFPSISSGMAFDSARGREDDDADGSIFGDAEEDRAFEAALGKAVRDGVRSYARARDARRRAADAEVDHRADFDPDDAEKYARARDEEILGQVPDKSVMTLHRGADSAHGFDATGRGRSRHDREVADSRTGSYQSGRSAGLLGELDGLLRGRA